MSLKLGTTLLFKGSVSDQHYMRIIRVYDGHFIIYEESPSEGGTVREAKVLNKEEMMELFDMLIENGVIDVDQVNDFLKDIRV